MRQSLQGKTCIITGASSGIGKAAACGIAALGADVVLVCRNPALGDTAMREVASLGGGSVELLIADLSSQHEIRRLAGEILDKRERIDVLVNNAGGIFGERRVTEDGIEMTLALNHLAYFLLSNLLVDRIRASAPARIVNVSSGAHRMAKIDWDDLQGARRYSGIRAYGLSKLCNILFTYELARRLDGTGVTVNCMHPGAVGTSFGVTGGKLMRRAFRLAGPLMRSPERGADTIVWMASAPELAGVTGKYFMDRKEKRSSRLSHDQATARRLWNASARLGGLDVQQTA